MAGLAPPPDNVAGYYDRLAWSYGEGELFGARRAAVLAAVAAELTGARKILDLGCGNGTYLAEFAARAPTGLVVGADLSSEMLRAAQGRLGTRAAVIRADATALPFSGARFDVVFMSHVLQLVMDTERCIAEVARCLIPGGRLISTVGTGGWRAAIGEILGSEAVQELAMLVESVRSRAPADDTARVAAACTAVGLEPTWRSAPLTVGWAAFEDWVRIRWFSMIDEVARERAESWLARARSRDAGLTLSISQTILVARKEPSEA